jgi:hypothetical protein
MTRTNLPHPGADQPMDEAASRRLMLSLFGKKAGSLATLLLRSAEVESAKSEPKLSLNAKFDASQFDAFMQAVNRRAKNIQDRGLGGPTQGRATKSNGASGLGLINTINPRAHRVAFPMALAALRFDRFAFLRSSWGGWALAAAALLVVIIGSTFLYRAHLDGSNVAGVPSTSFDLAGESKPASPPAASTSQQH